MRIPVGNFGNVIAPVAPSGRNIGHGPLVGDALVSAGNMLSVEARQMRAEEEAKRREAEKLKANMSIAKAKNDLADMLDEIDSGMSDGSIAKTDAEKLHAERSQKLMEGSLKGIDPEFQGQVRMHLDDAIRHGGRTVRKHVAARDQQDIIAGIGSYMEQMQRYAGRGELERQEAMRNVEAFLQSAGPQAGMKAQDIAKQAQAFKEGVTFNWLDRAISSGAKSSKTLALIQKDIAENKYPELDPAKRTALENKIIVRQDRIAAEAERAANRAERAQERFLKKAEAEFNTFQSLADKGTELAPEYVDRVMKMTAGTPYQEGIMSLVRQTKENGGIAAQPIAVQQAMLDKVDATIVANGRSPALDKRREQLQKVLNGSMSDVKANGLRAGLERGVISEIVPLDMSSPQNIASSLSARVSQAEAVSQWAGRTVSPLDAKEADAIQGMIDSLQPKDRAQTVALLSTAVGPRMAGAIAEQIDKKDRALALAFASASSQTTQNRYTSELIFKGATAIKDGTAMKDDKKVTGWKATIAKELEGVFPDARLETAAKEAAYFIAAGFAQEQGGSVSPDELKQAVRLAIGGGVIERNGKRLPVPAEMGETERERGNNFEQRIRNIPASDILRQAPDGKVRAGGAELAAENFARMIPGQELIYAGYGRYAVLVGGRPVTNTAGRPIIVTVR